jgi:CRP-like cAMP-binding protein
MTQSVAFSGSVEFLSLGELLQIIGNNGGTGVLRITSKYAPQSGLIYIDNGNPVDAANGDRSGTDALFSLFGWTEGEFSFSREAVDKKNVINKNRMEIILDGTRMVDDGKIEKLGPVSFKTAPAGSPGKSAALPMIKGPFVDYMYVVDEEDYYEGDEIVIEGNYGNWMWVILEGVVEIVKDTDKGPLKLLQLSDGAYVGSIASFLSESSVRNATATAVSRVQLGMLDSQRLSEEYATMSTEMRGVIKSLDNRLKSVTDSVARLHSGNGQLDHQLGSKRQVIEQGKNEERVFTITQGNVSIVRKLDEGALPLAELVKGDFFGRIPFLNMGHEPHAASVFASKDLKVAPLEPTGLQKEHQSLSPSFRNIIEHLATCVSVTTMIAKDHYLKMKEA